MFITTLKTKENVCSVKKTTILMFILLYVFSIKATATPLDFSEAMAAADKSSIPLVNITLNTELLCKETYTQGKLEIFDLEKRTDPPKELSVYNCKIKYRGATSLQYNKKSFAIKLLDDKGKSMDANILGIRKDDAWILNAMAIDRMRMRDRVLFDTWNDMSQTPYDTKYGNRNGTAGHFVEVYINGKYHGLYCMTDKINRKLLGLKKAETDDNENLAVLHGVLYKCNTWGDAAKFSGYDEQEMNGETWNNWELQYPDDYPCETSYTSLKQFIDFCAFTSDSEFIAGIDNNLWLDNFMDYQIFVIANGLNDNTMKNSFLSTEDCAAGKKMMITPWDLDCSLGELYNGDYFNDVSFTKQEEAHLYVKPYMRLWLQNINGYKDKVADRWRSLIKMNILSEEKFDNRIDTYVEQFVKSGAWQREYEKWNGNPVELKQSPWEEAEYLKSWYRMNMKHLENNIFYGLGTSGIDKCNKETYKAAHHKKNLFGQDVTENYNGIVIQDNKKFILK